MKGLRAILTMERGLRRAMEASIPPKEDEADLVPTNAWGLIMAAQVAVGRIDMRESQRLSRSGQERPMPGIKEKSLT